MSRPYTATQRDDVHATLHALSQPLTVISLALTLAQASSNEAERTLAVEAALVECQRAMRSVRQLRALVDESSESRLSSIGMTAVTGAEGSWEVGGLA